MQVCLGMDGSRKKEEANKQRKNIESRDKKYKNKEREVLKLNAVRDEQQEKKEM